MLVFLVIDFFIFFLLFFPALSSLTRAEAVAMARMCENFKQAGMAMRARAREEMEAKVGEGM